MPTADKRKGDDILALVPASKRTKNEVVFSSREKAVIQSVSTCNFFIFFLFFTNSFISFLDVFIFI